MVASNCPPFSRSLAMNGVVQAPIVTVLTADDHHLDLVGAGHGARLAAVMQRDKRIHASRFMAMPPSGV